jgi:hypothetical protein
VRQTGCVVAFSAFGDEPPENARFGRTTEPGREVLCTNPASLRGGSGLTDLIVPTRPFAQSVIGGVTAAANANVPKASTPWVSIRGAYRASCASVGGNVLRIAPRDGAPALTPLPDAAWGLHLGDVNIAFGNLLGLVRRQVAAFEARR